MLLTSRNLLYYKFHPASRETADWFPLPLPFPLLQTLSRAVLEQGLGQVVVIDRLSQLGLGLGQGHLGV